MGMRMRNYTRVIFIRNFFIRNQAQILQIYYIVTSLLLLKKLSLAHNPVVYNKPECIALSGGLYL